MTFDRMSDLISASLWSFVLIKATYNEHTETDQIWPVYKLPHNLKYPMISYARTISSKVAMFNLSLLTLFLSKWTF